MFTETNILTRGAVIDYAAKKLVQVDGRVLQTGFDDWDRACDETGQRGLGDWWYVLVGGASNSGKTQLLRHLARRAIDSDYTPAIITMEVSAHGLQRHYYSDITTFGYYDLLPHAWMDGEKDAMEKLDDLMKQVEDYSQMNTRSLIVVEAEGRPEIDQIVEEAYRLQEAGITHLFIDHAQLIKAPRGMDIAAAAEELSENMRIFAHQKQCCTFMASQLNRSASAQRDRKPTMHDLWGGTAMESNANQVVLLDSSRNERDMQRPHLLKTWLLLDKNREGPAKVEIPVEVNFRTGVWRQADEDEIEQKLWP